MKTFIEFKNVTFSYPGNKNTIKNINFTINQGEFVALVGPNGCGKSTIAKMFNALLLPSSGDVYIDGINTKEPNKTFQIRQNIGLILQNPDDQIVASIVEEDVAFGPENLSIEPSKIRELVDKALKTVNMYEFRNRAVYQLSGGQKQRVAIAGVLAMQPNCIILDEPTSMLDPKGRKDVIKMIKKLNKENKITIVLISHRMDEIANATRVIVMREGSIVRDAPVRELFSDYNFLKQNDIDISQGVELIHKLNQLSCTKEKKFKIPINKEECVKILKKALYGD